MLWPLKMGSLLGARQGIWGSDMAGQLVGSPTRAQVCMAGPGQPLSTRLLQPCDPRPLHPRLLFPGLLDLWADSVCRRLHPIPAYWGRLGSAFRHLIVLCHWGRGKWGSPCTKHTGPELSWREEGQSRCTSLGATMSKSSGLPGCGQHIRASGHFTQP